MGCVTKQGSVSIAPFVKVLKFVDIVAQDICLRCCFNYCRNWIVPIMKQFEYPILSSTRLIFLAFGSVFLYKPVCSFLAHGSNAKLTPLAPCPGFESGSRSMSKSPPASISNIFWLYEAE